MTKVESIISEDLIDSQKSNFVYEQRDDSTLIIHDDVESYLTDSKKMFFSGVGLETELRIESRTIDAREK